MNPPCNVVVPRWVTPTKDLCYNKVFNDLLRIGYVTVTYLSLATVTQPVKKGFEYAKH